MAKRTLTFEITTEDRRALAVLKRAFHYTSRRKPKADD